MEIAIRKLKLSAADLPESYMETVADFLTEILRKIVRFFGDLFSFLQRKADEILPPETRGDTFNRWIHVCLTVVLPVSLLLLFLYCCCFRGRCCHRLCCCCCRRRRASGGRMMRAPGRPGWFMPRPSFEADPQSYFANLRAKKELVF